MLVFLQSTIDETPSTIDLESVETAVKVLRNCCAESPQNQVTLFDTRLVNTLLSLTTNQKDIIHILFDRQRTLAPLVIQMLGNMVTANSELQSKFWKKAWQSDLLSSWLDAVRDVFLPGAAHRNAAASTLVLVYNCVCHSHERM